MRRGEAHCALVGEGSWPFCFGPEKTQRRQKGGLQNFKIPIFLTVAQDKPYKIPVTYFFKRFYENISGKCVNNSCQKEKPGRDKLSNEGQKYF